MKCVDNVDNKDLVLLVVRRLLFGSKDQQVSLDPKSGSSGTCSTGQTWQVRGQRAGLSCRLGHRIRGEHSQVAAVLP